MAGIKISELSNLDTIVGTEEVPVISAGSNYKVSLNEILGSSSSVVYSSNYPTADALNTKITSIAGAKIVLMDGNVDVESDVLTLPSGVIIYGLGGYFYDGEVVGDDTVLINTINKVFETTAFTSGTWIADCVYPEQFGALGDGTTNDAFAFQHAASLVNQTQCKAILKLLGKTYLLNPGSDQPTTNGRIILNTPSHTDTFKMEGSGRENTKILNTEQTWCGDLFCSVRASSQDFTTVDKTWYAVDMTNGEGNFVFKDFSIIGTYQGHTDGTSGCNPIGLVAPHSIIVERVDIINSGNRAITFESHDYGDLCKYIRYKDVYIKDTWKNALMFNQMGDDYEIYLENIIIDGYNLVANAGGAYVGNNTGIDFIDNESSSSSVTLKNVIIKNGYAQSLRFRNANYIEVDNLSIYNIEIKDESSGTFSYMIQFDTHSVDRPKWHLSNISISDITHNETIANYAIYGKFEGMIINNLKLKNLDYGFKNSSSAPDISINGVHADTILGIFPADLLGVRLNNVVLKSSNITPLIKWSGISRMKVANVDRLDDLNYTDKLEYYFNAEISAPDNLPYGWYSTIYSLLLPYSKVFLIPNVGLRIIMTSLDVSAQVFKLIKKIALTAGSDYQVRSKLVAINSGTSVSIYINETSVLTLSDTNEGTSSSFTATGDSTLEIGGTSFRGDFIIEYVIVELV